MPDRIASNLPAQVTSFVGREDEVSQVLHLLDSSRLVTLTGAGGCGKTRLALQVASKLLDSHPDGVWLVELAPLSRPALVAPTVAGVFRLNQQPGVGLFDDLADFLQDKRLCLLLDNCEHVVDTVAELVDRLLRGCPHVQVLTTSREALGIAGEHLFLVPSLTVPPQTTAKAALESLADYEAIRLFIERAQAVAPNFAPQEENAEALIEVCRRLDGIPLAIELAAARVPAFSIEQIAARLDDRFRFLTAGQRTALPRQQTLQATVDWSYNLLAEPERVLLRRLSVFAGGWQFEAAEAVAAGDGIESYALVDLLAQLVAKSLVLAEQHRGGVRYRLLDTIRDYARAGLAEAGEEGRTRDHHLVYFFAFAEASEAELRGPQERLTLDRLEEEHDNLRAALEWSLTPPRDDETALRLGGALAWFWYLRGYLDEGIGWLTRALDARPQRSAARMKALHSAAWLVHHRRDSQVARRLLDEGLSLAREFGDAAAIAWVLQVQGRVAYFEDDAESARILGEESLVWAEQAGDAWLTAYALHLLGLAGYVAGDYATAWQHYSRSLDIRLELGYREGIGILHGLMGLTALQESDFGRSLELLRKALDEVSDTIGPWAVGTFLGCFAYIAAIAGDHPRAARLARAASRLIRAQRAPVIPIFEPVLERASQMSRQALAPDAFAAAEAEGLAMSLDDILSEARAVEAPAGAAPRWGGEQAGVFAALTPAEAQVLRLLTTGRTTREIAEELVVAVSTVDRHLTHIYDKLGVRNRAEAIALTLQQQASESSGA